MSLTIQNRGQDPEALASVNHADGEPVAKASSTPFAFGITEREELPDGGWDVDPDVWVEHRRAGV